MTRQTDRAVMRHIKKKAAARGKVEVAKYKKAVKDAISFGNRKRQALTVLQSLDSGGDNNVSEVGTDTVQAEEVLQDQLPSDGPRSGEPDA